MNHLPVSSRGSSKSYKLQQEREWAAFQARKRARQTHTERMELAAILFFVFVIVYFGGHIIRFGIFMAHNSPLFK